MSAPNTAKLYTPELLALAVELADYPLNSQLPLTGEARSRSCGSSLQVGLSLNPSDQIENIGMRVTACAVGQAAAAIFASSAKGTTPEQLTTTLSQIDLWLSGQGDLPDWRGLTALTPARDHAGRHGAILLPWKAAHAALCKNRQAG